MSDSILCTPETIAQDLGLPVETYARIAAELGVTHPAEIAATNPVVGFLTSTWSAVENTAHSVATLASSVPQLAWIGFGLLILWFALSRLFGGNNVTVNLSGLPEFKSSRGRMFKKK